MSHKSSSLSDLASVASEKRWRGPAPVHLWDPPFCGDIDIEIHRDGSWWHEGRAIRRAGMAELFASLLLYQDGDYFLVTPAEKVRIKVEDCPFFANQLRVESLGDKEKQALYLKTSLGEEVLVDAEHPLDLELGAAEGSEPHPVLMVRSGLKALIARSVYYELANIAVSELTPDGECLGVWSAGQFFRFE